MFQIAVPKLSEVPEARVLTVAQGSDNFEDKNFTTKSLSAATSVNTVCQLVKKTNLPAGALPGEFSVGPNTTDKVHFSKGNLYADNQYGTWNFYDEQYKYNSLSTSNSRQTHYYDLEIDLFTWGYSASKSLLYDGTTYVDGHTSKGDQLVYNKSSSDSEKQGDDWGVAYCESNSIAVGTWRTLTNEEWQYLFKTDTPNRMVNGKPCYSNAMSGVTIGGTTYYGVFLYPDDYSGKEVVDNTETWTWDKINSAGIVFLPAAGNRNGGTVSYVGNNGSYWSSTAYSKNNAYLVKFVSNTVTTGGNNGRKFGYSVRLITESK